MILRRVIMHVKDQQWVVIALDLVIVVVGVFIGIQVSNWNTERVERLQERELLIRLYEDVEESIEGQARDIRFLDQQLADQGVILSSLDACQVSSNESEAFQRGLTTLGFFNPPRIYRRTIDEMAAAGKTDIIRSEIIKKKLANIVALVEWRAQGFDQSSRTSEHHRFILEEKIRYDLNRSFPNEFIPNMPGVDFVIEELCKDSSSARAVSAVRYHTSERRAAYLPILDAYSAFLPLLAKELEARWHVDAAAISNR